MVCTGVAPARLAMVFQVLPVVIRIPDARPIVVRLLRAKEEPVYSAVQPALLAPACSPSQLGRRTIAVLRQTQPAILSLAAPLGCSPRQRVSRGLGGLGSHRAFWRQIIQLPILQVPQYHGVDLWACLASAEVQMELEGSVLPTGRL